MKLDAVSFRKLPIWRNVVVFNSCLWISVCGWRPQTQNQSEFSMSLNTPSPPALYRTLFITPFFSHKNNEPQTMKKKMTKTQLLRCKAATTATNKAGSAESFHLNFTPTHRAAENVNKRGQTQRKSSSLERNCGCGRGQRVEGGRESGEKGRSSMPTESYITGEESEEYQQPEPQLHKFPHATSLLLHTVDAIFLNMKSLKSSKLD